MVQQKWSQEQPKSQNQRQKKLVAASKKTKIQKNFSSIFLS